MNGEEYTGEFIFSEEPYLLLEDSEQEGNIHWVMKVTQNANGGFANSVLQRTETVDMLEVIEEYSG